jgi:flagellar hook-associated protein 3 FlgL
MLYITSSYSMNTALRRTLTGLQTELSRSQKELASGRHADLALALGARASRSFALGAARETLETIRSTNNLVSARLDTTDKALTNLLTNARALRATLLSAQTDGGEPGAVVAQARNALASMISTLNGGDGEGFLFGGVNNAETPIAHYFADPPSTNKLALDEAFRVAFGFAQTDPAVADITPAQIEAFLTSAFEALFNEDGWKSDWSKASDDPLRSQISMSVTIDTSITANEPALRKLAAAYVMVADLGASGMNAESYGTVLRTALRTIDASIDTLTRTQARVGVMQGSVNNASDSMSIQSDTLRLQLRDLEAVDETEVATRINILLTQLEASLTMTSRISQLSLTRYL